MAFRYFSPLFSTFLSTPMPPLVFASPTRITLPLRHATMMPPDAALLMFSLLMLLAALLLRYFSLPLMSAAMPLQAPPRAMPFRPCRRRCGLPAAASLRHFAIDTPHALRHAAIRIISPLAITPIFRCRLRRHAAIYRLRRFRLPPMRRWRHFT